VITEEVAGGSKKRETLSPVGSDKKRGGLKDIDARSAVAKNLETEERAQDACSGEER